MPDNKLKFVSFALGVLIASSAAAETNKEPAADATTTMSCRVVTQAQIEALFDRWNQSLQTLNAQKVGENYASDAVLLPTLSNKTRYTDEERVDYFKHFLQKHPVGHIDSRKIRIGCNEAMDTGNYTFDFKDGSKPAHARYTFTYAWNGKDWLITSHHSSALPEEH